MQNHQTIWLKDCILFQEYQQFSKEQQEALEEQLQLLFSSINGFDNRQFWEALNIAIRLRVFLHDATKSTSLLTTLGVKGNFSFIDTKIGSNDVEGCAQSSYAGFIKTFIGNGNIGITGFLPILDDNDDIRSLSFDKWRNDIIFRDIFGNILSRKDVVLSIANKDGGAHVDFNYDEKWKKMVKQNSLGFAYGNDKNWYPAQKLEYLAVRQIAHEFLKSLFVNYSFNYNYEGCNGYMRYLCGIKGEFK